ESSVVPYWTTERRAVLTLRQQILGWRERVARVEALIAQETVHAAAPIVGPGAGKNVDDATRSPAKLRAAARSNDLKLVDHFFAVVGAGQICRVVIRGNA